MHAIIRYPSNPHIYIADNSFVSIVLTMIRLCIHLGYITNEMGQLTVALGAEQLEIGVDIVFDEIGRLCVRHHISHIPVCLVVVGQS
jgi:hypothetical protein